MDTTSLQAFVQQINPLPSKEMEALLSKWQPITLKRKSILTAAGETEHYLYFVLEGVQRAFYLGEGNKEATIVFTYPPSFSGIADSFLRNHYCQPPVTNFLRGSRATYAILPGHFAVIF